MDKVSEGRLSTGQHYLKAGQGPPLFLLPGLSGDNENPTGMLRRAFASWVVPFAEHFTVYRLQRKVGLPVGASMADIAAEHASAIRRDIGRPVLLHGISSGGSIALQLAVDHPDLVQRMVVAAAACRLAPPGRQVVAGVVRLTEGGDERRASARMMEALVTRRLAHAAYGAGWLAGRRMAPADPSDMLVMLKAEHTFDVESELHRVQAPTLVLGGAADRFYSEDLFRRTAAGIPDGRAVVFPGKAHSYAADSKVATGLTLGFLLG